MAKTESERAEVLSQRRARMLPVLVVIYFSQQAAFFSAVNGDRAVDHVKIGAWVVFSLVLLLALVTRGSWFMSRRVRDMVDDEASRANRTEALKTGFIVANGTAIFIYVASQFAPLSAREAIHLIVSLGIGCALLRFAMLERRDHRNG
jgi:Na+-transporting methylmalonyl-CoA/oxaloacetate decarboxylase gamma subunit